MSFESCEDPRILLVELAKGANRDAAAPRLKRINRPEQ